MYTHTEHMLFSDDATFEAALLSLKSAAADTTVLR